MKITLSKDFILSNITKNLEPILNFYKNDLVKGFDLSHIIDNRICPDRTLVYEWSDLTYVKEIDKIRYYSHNFLLLDTSCQDFYNLFYISIFKHKKHGSLYLNNLFCHIFENNELKYTRNDCSIYEYFISINSYYITTMDTHCKYYFKLDKNNNLLLPEFSDLELDVNPSDLLDCKETRKLLFTQMFDGGIQNGSHI